MKKRIAITTFYWASAVCLIAVALSSLEFSFPEALVFGSLFLPGALAMKYALSLIVREDSKECKVKNIVFATLAVTSLELALVILASGVIMVHRESYMNGLEVPGIMLNPVFIVLLLGIMIAGDYFLGQFIDNSIPVKEEPLTFFSDRRKETIIPSEIVYIESNDTEVWIHMEDGRKLRNKTAISRWQDLLGEGFIRVHRSYLVNKACVSSASASQITLGDVSLPVSKKYAEIVVRLFSRRKL